MIADLGIAKDLAKRGDTMTLIGGTPAFRAPEQLDREAQVTPAADVFAAAAVLWYDRRLISQGRAAEIAGLSRAAFIDALSRYGVTPFQVDAEELIEEALGG